MRSLALLMTLVLVGGVFPSFAQEAATTRSLEALHVLSGHSYIVKSVAFSPDSALVASRSDGEVFLWNTSSGERLAAWFDPQDDVIRLLFHPTWPLLFAASEDGNVYVYDLETLELSQTLREMRDDVRDIALNRSGTLLVAVGDGEIVPLWSIGESNVVLRGALDPLTLGDWSVSIGTNGVIYFADDRSLQSFDLNDGYSTVWQDESGTWIVDIRVLTDGTIVFGRDSGKQAYVYRSGELLEIPTIALLAIDTSSSDHVVITDASRVKLLEPSTLEIVAEFRADDPLWSVAISPDGTRIAAGSSGEDVYILRVE